MQEIDFLYESYLISREHGCVDFTILIDLPLKLKANKFRCDMFKGDETILIYLNQHSGTDCLTDFRWTMQKIYLSPDSN